MKRGLAGLALAALSAAAAAANLPPDVAQALKPYDEFRAHELLAWHPEKREVMVRRIHGASDAPYLVSAPGASPQPLATVAGKVVAASHSGSQAHQLVFIADNANGSRSLQRVNLATGTVSGVSPDAERAIDFAWNPEGDRVAYATRSGDATIVRMGDPARPTTERLLARLDGRWSGLRFAPGGRRLALVHEEGSAGSHVWVMGVATGTRRRVTRPDRKAPASYRDPTFTPDGRAIFALSDRGSEYRRLVLIPLEGGPERPLTGHLSYDVDAFSVSADAGLLVFITNERGSHVLRFIDLVTLKEQPRPPLFDGVIGGLAWRPKSREIGFHITSARTAGDVFSYDAKANQLTRWTNGNSPGVNTRDFAESQVIKWKSADGREVSGLLYQPPARFTGKRAVIVDHRAGAGSQWRAGFLGRLNYVVGEMGVAIIRPNPRGSSGFGKSFAAMGSGALRDEAQKDVAALLEWIATQPALDAARTVVIGEGIAGQPDDEAFLAAAVDFALRLEMREPSAASIR